MNTTIRALKNKGHYTNYLLVVGVIRTEPEVELA